MSLTISMAVYCPYMRSVRFALFLVITLVFSLVAAAFLLPLPVSTQSSAAPSWSCSGVSRGYVGSGVGYRVGVKFVRDVFDDLAFAGDPEATFSLAFGTALPDGLTLRSDGAIIGTPTQSGTFSFSLIARNTAGSVLLPVSLIIRDPFLVTTPYTQQDSNPDILDAQVFLNSTDCPCCTNWPRIVRAGDLILRTQRPQQQCVATNGSMGYLRPVPSPKRCSTTLSLHTTHSDSPPLPVSAPYSIPFQLRCGSKTPLLTPHHLSLLPP